MIPRNLQVLTAKTMYKVYTLNNYKIYLLQYCTISIESSFQRNKINSIKLTYFSYI